MYANEFETKENKNKLKQKINCNIYNKEGALYSSLLQLRRKKSKFEVQY